MSPEGGASGKQASLVGAYETLEEIGSGRTATVYRARPLSGGADVALKVLHRHLASDSVLRERFRREIEISRRLAHPNILPVYDLVAWDEAPAAVMEYCPAGDLGKWAHLPEAGAGPDPGSKPISGADLLSIARQIGSALEAAHRVGVVHRDLKPSNLFRARNGAVKVGDFGSAVVSSLLGLTRSTVSFGSPEYTPPESLLDPYPDPRWDLYSLGAVLYRLGTGRSHMGATSSVLPSEGGAREPPIALNPGIDPRLSDAILALLEPIEERTTSATAFLESLMKIGEHGGFPKEFRIARPKRKPCLFCGASMPFEAPLCLSCGEADIIFEPCLGEEAEALILQKLPEHAATMENFYRTARAIANDPTLNFRFITEDKRLYSKEERKSSVTLPAKLLDSLHPGTIDRLMPIFSADSRNPVILKRKPVRKTRRQVALLMPRRCPPLPESVLEVIRGCSAVGSTSRPPADLSILEKGTFAAARGAASIAAGGRGAEPSHALGDLAALLGVMNRAVADATKIREGLDSVSLGEIYARIRALERTIADSSDPHEVDDSMRRKRELESMIEAHRKGEEAHAKLISRIVTLAERLEKFSAGAEGSLAGFKAAFEAGGA